MDIVDVLVKGLCVVGTVIDDCVVGTVIDDCVDVVVVTFSDGTSSGQTTASIQLTLFDIRTKTVGYVSSHPVFVVARPMTSFKDAKLVFRFNRAAPKNPFEWYNGHRIKITVVCVTIQFDRSIYLQDTYHDRRQRMWHRKLLFRRVVPSLVFDEQST